jgi:hypothetical protein
MSQAMRVAAMAVAGVDREESTAIFELIHPRSQPQGRANRKGLWTSPANRLSPSHPKTVAAVIHLLGLLGTLIVRALRCHRTFMEYPE